MSEKRVAYFVSKWHLHQQVVDGALMFAENGYIVDLFLYQTSSTFHKIKNHANIHIHDFTIDKEKNNIFPRDNAQIFGKDYLDILNGNKKVVVFGTGQKARELVEIFPTNIDYYVDNNSEKWNTSFLGKKIYSPDELLKEDPSNLFILIASMYYREIEEQLNEMGFSKDFAVVYNATEVVEQFVFCELVVNKSKRIIEKHQYNAFIGVEKVGLIWAGIIAEKFKIPYIYHSLELYTSDHPSWNQPKFQPLLQMEALYHQNATATIIQDESRKEVLFSEHKIEKGKPLYVTISILDEKLPINKNRFWHEKFNIPLHKKIILLLALIGPNRYCLELVRASQFLEEEYQVIIHGPVFDKKYFEKLKLADKKNKIILSTQIFDDEELQKIVSAADIGLVFYHENPINDRLTPFSSEKIARYLQVGLPIITFDYKEYKAMHEKFNCGKYIDPSFKEFQNAILEINSNYSQYSNYAREAFIKCYEFKRQYHKVLDFINERNH